jgi:two-component system OmpR family response regulator
LAEIQPTLLVVDDDAETRNLVRRYLERHGISVSTARDGQELALQMKHGRFDLIVLDVMLPGPDGFSICRDLRSGSQIPIIMLTAMNELADRVVGLEFGADDYISKPFEPRELLARIRAVLRRNKMVSTEEPADSNVRAWRFEGWLLDVSRRRVESPNKVLVTLTSAEFDLLTVLVANRNRVLSREQLLDLTQGRSAEAFDRSIDVLISRIRKKLQNDANAQELIRTVRGTGYQFMAKVERA